MKDKFQVVYNYKNTIQKSIVRNKKEENETQIGVYKIPCKDCNLAYYGESGRGLDIRLLEHKRAYANHASNSALVQHSLDKDHRINWDETTMIFNTTDIGIRRLIEGAAIDQGNSMPGNKSFTQEGKIINKSLCINFIRNFIFKHDVNTIIATPDTASSLSPAQVTGGAPPTLVTGTYADDVSQSRLQQVNLRRSRRIAGMNTENDGIT